jgi:hypothetical protein
MTLLADAIVQFACINDLILSHAARVPLLVVVEGLGQEAWKIYMPNAGTAESRSAPDKQ